MIDNEEGPNTGSSSDAATSTGSKFSDRASENRDGLIVTPAVAAAEQLDDDEPQVRAASAPPPPAEAWERAPLLSPKERAARAGMSQNK
jgi:hypothetical protein